MIADAVWIGSCQVISEQQRARDEAEKKVHALSRRMDHLERARREEESPLLEAAFQEKVRYQSSLLQNPPCIKIIFTSVFYQSYFYCRCSMEGFKLLSC